MSFNKIVSRNIATIKTSGAKLSGLMHDTAMLIMQHARKSGDVSKMTSLANALPVHVKTQDLESWTKQFGPISVKETEKNGRVFTMRQTWDSADLWNLEEAQKTPFWTPKAKTVPNHDFDVTKELLRLVAKYDAAKEHKGKILGERVLIEAIRDMAASPVAVAASLREVKAANQNRRAPKKVAEKTAETAIAA